MTAWGIIGAGWAASDFVQDLAVVPDAAVAAVASPHRAPEFAARFGIPRHYSDAAELVSDPAVDIVYVATPHPLHAGHALAAIGAGKPVLCEKPFAMSAAEAQRVLDAAHAAGVLCLEAMPMRFVPATLRAAALIRDGAIGDPRMLTASLGHRPERDPANRYFDPAKGGGALLDVGVYGVSLAVMLFGAPVGVSASAVVGASGVDEQSAAILTFAQDRLASVQGSLLAAPAPEAVITGTRGTIRVSPLYRPNRVELQRFDAPKRGRARRVLARVWGADAASAPYPGNGFSSAAIEATRCLEAGLTESPVLPAAQTLMVMETLDAIRQQWAT